MPALFDNNMISRIRNRMSQMMTDDTFLQGYFSTLTGAQRKAAQTAKIDLAIAAQQANIDNIDTEMITVKAQRLASYNQEKLELQALREQWVLTLE